MLPMFTFSRPTNHIAQPYIAVTLTGIGKQYGDGADNIAENSSIFSLILLLLLLLQLFVYSFHESLILF